MVGQLCVYDITVPEALEVEKHRFLPEVTGVYRPNGGESGFSYRGDTLDNCDAIKITVELDLSSWTVEGEVYMYCGFPAGTAKAGELAELGAAAKFGVSALVSRRSNFQRLAKNANLFYSILPPLLTNRTQSFILAGVDVGLQSYAAHLASNKTGLITYSGMAEFESCPPSYVKDHPCGARLNQPPIVNITIGTAITSDLTILPPDILLNANPPPYNLTESLRAPMLNFFHLARATAQIDLGNSAPNNFLTNPSMIDAVLIPEFPSAFQPGSTARSQLYDAWKSQKIPRTITNYATLAVPGPATLQAPFICHFYRLKSPGSLVVSVMVATLSMFSSAWGLSIVLAARILKNKKGVEGEFEF
ncbi:hypothetical protein DFP72DRAFT_828487 [Ephemerocybe angulata]|uniref:Uncharacterized protein n=1 Tax=Ephemerocybe angulata TaxID=980116 RepID=A0A8H6HA60_9AGAR|nr:hypothetical protein DFP72DRAFT_828487 [Tulosesus angulatus]